MGQSGRRSMKVEQVGRGRRWLWIDLFKTIELPQAERLSVVYPSTVEPHEASSLLLNCPGPDVNRGYFED